MDKSSSPGPGLSHKQRVGGITRPHTGDNSSSSLNYSAMDLRPIRALYLLCTDKFCTAILRIPLESERRCPVYSCMSGEEFPQIEDDS